MKAISLQIKQTKAGQDYKQFQMEDGKRLSVFQFDTRYAEVVEGIDIPDDQLIYDQQYDNYKLKPLPKPAGAPRGGFGGKQAEALMEKKNESIKGFQDDKEKSIRLTAAMRDATQIALASLKDQPFPTSDDFKEEWTKWVKWLLAQGEQPFI